MEKSEELIKLEEEQENNSRILTDLYVKRNMLEEELNGIKDTIKKYKNIIQELEAIKLKLPKYLIKGIIISLVPLISALLVSIGPIIMFYSIKEVMQMVLGCSLMTALVLTPPSMLIGFKDYFKTKRTLKNNNIDTLKLLLEKEEKTKNIIIEENKENNEVIKLNEEEKEIIKSCINEILNKNFSNEVTLTNVEEDTKEFQKVKK